MEINTDKDASLEIKGCLGKDINMGKIGACPVAICYVGGPNLQGETCFFDSLRGEPNVVISDTRTTLGERIGLHDNRPDRNSKTMRSALESLDRVKPRQLVLDLEESSLAEPIASTLFD